MSNFRIPLSDLDYGPEEEAAVLHVLRSKWLSMGTEVEAFEKKIAEFIGVKHAFAVSNGTAALHLAYLCLGLGAGDEVIQPAINFVAAANMTVALGSTPVFSDIVGIDEPTIDPADLEGRITSKTKAVLVMHYGGYLCRMAEIHAICKRHDLFLIEDACHAIGARYLDPQERHPHKKMAGSIGDIAAFSFFSNKNLATGEGGMVVTNRDDFAERIRLLRSHGMTTLTWDRHRGHASSYDVVTHGYNYRFNEIGAALGQCQLSKLQRNNQRRGELVSAYRKHLRALPGWIIPFGDSSGNSAFHLMVAVAPTEEARLQTVEILTKNRIQTSLHYPFLPELSAFKGYPRKSLARSVSFASRIITLPLFPTLTLHDVEKICACIVHGPAKTFPNMNTPKVLMIAPGDNIHSLRPLNWLLEEGSRVVFSNGFNPFPDGREGYTFKRFPNTMGERTFPKLLGENIGARLFRLSEFTTVLRLRMLWRCICPTLVHVHWVDARAHYCVKAGLHPLVLTVWGSDINSHFLPNADPASRRRVGETLGGADLILIDSADMHEKCAELAGRAVPTELFSLGLNTERFRPGYAEAALEWRRRLSIPADATVLLSIRAWSPRYRHGDILEAFARALPRLKSEAVLVIKILKHPNMDRSLYENRMRELAEKLGAAQRVRWMEAVPLDQMPEIYSFADVILNYPSMDAFPVTFLEAAACERPVISCRLPAYAGTFAEEYFRLVSSDDLSELSDAIVEFVTQGRAALRGRLSELRRVVCKNYDEKIVAGRLLEIYNRMASGIL